MTAIGSKANLAAWANTTGHQYIGTTIEKEDVLSTAFEKVAMIIGSNPF